MRYSITNNEATSTRGAPASTAAPRESPCAEGGGVQGKVRASPTTQVWSIRIENEAGKLVCISRLTVAVIPLERK